MGAETPHPALAGFGYVGIGQTDVVNYLEDEEDAPWAPPKVWQRTNRLPYGR